MTELNKAEQKEKEKEKIVQLIKDKLRFFYHGEDGSVYSLAKPSRKIVDQISSIIGEAFPELAKARGYVKPAKDQTPPSLPSKTEQEKWREEIARIVCSLSDIPSECASCRQGDGCPDTWIDVAEKVDAIQQLYKENLPELAKARGWKSPEECAETYLAGVNAGIEADNISKALPPCPLDAFQVIDESRLIWQSPDGSFTCSHDYKKAYTIGYKQAQQDMLRAGYVKPGKFDLLVKKPITGLSQVGNFPPEEYQPILGDIPPEPWELTGYSGDRYLTVEGRKTILDNVYLARKAKADWNALSPEDKAKA